MAKIGFNYVLLFLIFSLIFFISGGLLNYIFGVVFFLLMSFCFYFFRDPIRKIIVDENVILSPADGTVFEISDVDEPLVIKGRAKIVKIFLSVFNVHLQRTPVSGKISFINKEGTKYLPANHPDACVKNVQNLIGIKNGQMSILVKQIAGIIAQRCDLWIKLNQDVVQGEKIGIIHFGSQVDIYFPENIKLKVAVGDKVTAGITVIAERQRIGT
ncbi:MAG: phosphatidylserine decarboxylase family protein [Elusimicrobia bacterium HGW-Elusimicrobia-4]|nr:MAG: phosphatidylserine decarboxylase family protein [Elusimicrobia bacterium HGW-Elusimicrobia-4]